MADKGFQMPPSQRREPKQFEPPPWERDAFEELQRRRAEADAARDAEVAREAEAAKTADAAKQADAAERVGTAPQTGEPSNVKEEGARPEEQAAVDKTSGQAAGEAKQETVPAVAPQSPAGAEGLNESMVEAMLLQLAAEEPREDRAISTVQLWVSIALYGLAVPLIIWGMAALVGARETGMTGMVSGFVLLMFGAGSIAGAIYLTVKSLQKRGVL